MVSCCPSITTTSIKNVSFECVYRICCAVAPPAILYLSLIHI